MKLKSAKEQLSNEMIDLIVLGSTKVLQKEIDVKNHQQSLAEIKL